MIEEVRGDRPALQRVVIIDSDEWTGLFDRSGDVARVRAVQAELTPDDPINIQYTSGTTGFPKGATLSHHNILNNGFFVGQLLGYTDADRVCIPVPFYHCFGMVMGNLACTSSGATMVIPAPGFDPTATLEAVAQERCTSLYGVPTMFIAELGLDELRVLRPHQPAHRDHGRLAVPDRGDEAGRRADGHERGHDLLRHDRDQPRSRPRPAPTTRSTAGCPRSGARCPTSSRRSSTRRPGAPCRAASPASCAPAGTR